MRVLLALFLLLAAAVAESDEIVAGVDLDRVDWPSFCPGVEPVPIGNCAVSHPTDNIHAVHAPFVIGEPVYVCETLKNTYERRTTCKDPTCRLCRDLWTHALKERERVPDWYASGMQLEAFRARYFSDAIAD